MRFTIATSSWFYWLLCLYFDICCHHKILCVPNEDDRVLRCRLLSPVNHQVQWRPHNPNLIYCSQIAHGQWLFENCFHASLTEKNSLQGQECKFSPVEWMLILKKGVQANVKQALPSNYSSDSLCCSIDLVRKLGLKILEANSSTNYSCSFLKHFLCTKNQDPVRVKTDGQTSLPCETRNQSRSDWFQIINIPSLLRDAFLIIHVNDYSNDILVNQGPGRAVEYQCNRWRQRSWQSQEDSIRQWTKRTTMRGIQRTGI